MNALATPGPLELSVVIPVYNRPALLERALRSVAAQRPRAPAEVIVVDDGSTEPLQEVVDSYDVKLIRHAENRGLSAARNTGVAAARHPWVALLDSDDEWLPHHLATIWPLRDGHLLVASSALRCGPDPAGDRVQGPVHGRLETLGTPAPLLFPDNLICPSATMVRREEVLAAGGFEAHQGVVEDLYLWCKLLDSGSGVVSPTVSLRYYVHEEQMSRDFELMHAAHLSVTRAFHASDWWSRALVERREGAAAWSRMRAYGSRGDVPRALRAGSGILCHPQRALGVLGIVSHRLRGRRRTSRVRRDGSPSVVLMPGDQDASARVREALEGLSLDDWSATDRVAALLRLARRPRAIAVVHSRPQALLARLAGARPVDATILWMVPWTR